MHLNVWPEEQTRRTCNRRFNCNPNLFSNDWHVAGGFSRGKNKEIHYVKSYKNLFLSGTTWCVCCWHLVLTVSLPVRSSVKHFSFRSFLRSYILLDQVDVHKQWVHCKNGPMHCWSHKSKYYLQQQCNMHIHTWCIIKETEEICEKKHSKGWLKHNGTSWTQS